MIIPAKDEATRIGPVIQQTFLQGYTKVVVVDDGSEDDTAKVARSLGATVLRHPINLGVGAATQTGIDYALSKGAKILVTIDGDHQHFPSDIPNLVKRLKAQKADLVIGSRFISSTHLVPWWRRIYNLIGNFITFLIAGKFVSDSQSGMKAFTAEFAQKGRLKFNGFEFCTEIIRNASHQKAKVVEIPIQVQYSEETLKKGQSFFSGVMMLVRLIMRWRY